MRRAQGSIHVFTFKDGVLARMAHDLQLHLERFEIGLEGESLVGEFDLASLLVDGPVRDGVVQPDEYDAGKKAEVQKAMHEEVLHTAQHPKARFTGRAVPDGGGFKVSGQLELAGKSAPLAFDVAQQGGQYRAAIELVPSRWGIAQYKALLGAIKVQDVVRIELALRDA
jgi:polyisoprenoid-binding protein YceI